MVEKFKGERKKGEHEAQINNSKPAILEYRGDEEIIPPKRKKGL